jgi:hypothetical protein
MTTIELIIFLIAEILFFIGGFILAKLIYHKDYYIKIKEEESKVLKTEVQGEIDVFAPDEFQIDQEQQNAQKAEEEKLTEDFVKDAR